MDKVQAATAGKEPSLKDIYCAIEEARAKIKPDMDKAVENLSEKVESFCKELGLHTPFVYAEIRQVRYILIECLTAYRSFEVLDFTYKGGKEQWIKIEKIIIYVENILQSNNKNTLQANYPCVNKAKDGLETLLNRWMAVIIFDHRHRNMAIDEKKIASRAFFLEIQGWR